jgi:hypothetical protein
VLAAVWLVNIFAENRFHFAAISNDFCHLIVTSESFVRNRIMDNLRLKKNCHLE